MRASQRKHLQWTVIFFCGDSFCPKHLQRGEKTQESAKHVCLDSCCLVTFLCVLVFVLSFLCAGVMTCKCEAGFDLRAWWLISVYLSQLSHQGTCLSLFGGQLSLDLIEPCFHHSTRPHWLNPFFL